MFFVSSPTIISFLAPALGWNYIVKDKKLFISQCDWLERIEKKRDAVESEIARLELENNQSPQTQNTPFGVLCPMMRDRADLNRQPPA